MLSAGIAAGRLVWPVVAAALIAFAHLVSPPTAAAAAISCFASHCLRVASLDRRKVDKAIVEVTSADGNQTRKVRQADRGTVGRVQHGASRAPPHCPEGWLGLEG